MNRFIRLVLAPLIVTVLVLAGCKQSKTADTPGIVLTSKQLSFLKGYTLLDSLSRRFPNFDNHYHFYMLFQKKAPLSEEVKKARVLLPSGSWSIGHHTAFYTAHRITITFTNGRPGATTLENAMMNYPDTGYTQCMLDIQE